MTPVWGEQREQIKISPGGVPVVVQWKRIPLGSVRMQVQPLAWELLYAAGAALKRRKEEKNQSRKEIARVEFRGSSHLLPWSHGWWYLILVTESDNAHRKTLVSRVRGLITCNLVADVWSPAPTEGPAKPSRHRFLQGSELNGVAKSSHHK